MNYFPNVLALISTQYVKKVKKRRGENNSATGSYNLKSHLISSTVLFSMSHLFAFYFLFE